MSFLTRSAAGGWQEGSVEDPVTGGRVVTPEEPLAGAREGDGETEAGTPAGPAAPAAPAGPAGPAAPAWRSWRSWAGWTVTALAACLVLCALLAPNRFSRLGPGVIASIPLEVIVGVAAALLLPGRARRVTAALAGAGLGLLTVVKLIDYGFSAVLGRRFHVVLDWTWFGPAVEYLTGSVGRTGAIGTAVLAGVLAVAVVVLMTLSVLRLTSLVVRHDAIATALVGALCVVWVSASVLQAEVAPGVPVAGRSTASYAYHRAVQAHTDLYDREAFAEESAVDAFAGTPGHELLTGLRGKDVMLTFIESYGRSAVEDPKYAGQVSAVLAAGEQRLRAAGYTSRSAFLTSPTSGGGSWLAHATLQSGLWVNNDRRYRTLVASDRLTLTGAFGRADWRTVAVAPGVTRDWPEARFYGFEKVYAARTLGYRGPKFSWAPVPDQFTLARFERLEHSKPQRPPIMAEIPLVSSHTPWTPLPELIDWDDVGDPSVYDAMAEAGDSPEEVWRDRKRVRTQYRRSIEYSLNTLISYVETYGDDDLVLVFLGDHQPAPIITGDRASRDVPITIVTRDRAVLDRIAAWGWHDGLKPGPRAPVWRMNTFRDRFLTTFGSRPRPAASTAPTRP